MKCFFLLILGLLASVAGVDAQTASDLNAGSQLTYTGTTGSYIFSWWGVSGYTYLIEASDDLVNWSYAPIVESGSNSVIEWGLSSTSSNTFVKLEYITLPASQLPGTVVFSGTSDAFNGLPEDWELFYFGYTGVDPNMDPNGMGFTVMQDYENGNNPIANQVVSVGPCVGEYLLHETSGTIAHDISSLHNNGAISSGASWAAGGYDDKGTLAFSGTNSSVLISNSSHQVFPATGAPFSLAFWFNPNASVLSGTAVLVGNQSGSISGFQIAIDATTSPASLQFSTSGSNPIQLEAPFPPGGWTHAAVAYDGTTAALYVNGLEVTDGTGTLVSNTNRITVATSGTGSQSYVGSMEELRFYQAALQPWDVIALYNISTTMMGPDSSEMANWWKYKYFGTLSVSSTASVSWSSGQVTNLQAWQQGLNPVDEYSGETPNLTVQSGASQTGSAGGFVSAPLIVSVTDSNGNPLPRVPVTFTVTTGSGNVQASSTASALTTLTAFSDITGAAQVFFKSPPTLSSSSQITATSGTGTSPSQVAFSEYTDSGTGIYTSPFAPSNVNGSMNSDGTETITWENNDSVSPIYIYTSSSNGWIVTGTLDAGTSSYVTSGSNVGAIEIGNNYSAGGSSGLTGGGGGGGGGAEPEGGGSSLNPNAGNAPYNAIPTLNYVVFDMSGPTTGAAASNVALDDSNNAAFVIPGASITYDTQPGIQEFDTYEWKNGAAGSKIVTSGTSAEGDPGSIFFRSPPVTVTTPANLYGQEVSYNFNTTNNTEIDYYPDASYISSSGSATDVTFLNSLYSAPDYEEGISLRDASSNGTLLGTAMLPISGTGTGTGDHYFTFIKYTDGSSLVFDTGTYGSLSIPSNLTVDSTDSISVLMAVSNQGYAIGYDGNGNAVVWSGSSYGLVQLSPMQAVTAISNAGQVVGSADSVGYLWTSGTASTVCELVTPGSVQSIQDLIPSAYKGYFESISPIDISGTNSSDGSVRILFNAQYISDAANDISNGTFLLTLKSGLQGDFGGASILEQVYVPSNVTVDMTTAALNAQGGIAVIGNISMTTGTTVTTGTNHALLLLPAPIGFVANTLKTDAVSVAAEIGGKIGTYGQRASFTSGNFAVQGNRGMVTQSVSSDPDTSPGYECGTTIGILGDSGGMFEVLVTNLLPGNYTANIKVTCAAYSTNSMSNAAVLVTSSNANQYLLSGQGTGNTIFSKTKTLDVAITPDSSGTAVIAISKPRLSAEQGGQSSEGVIININSVTGVSGGSP